LSSGAAFAESDCVSGWRLLGCEALGGSGASSEGNEEKQAWWQRAEVRSADICMRFVNLWASASLESLETLELHTIILK